MSHAATKDGRVLLLERLVANADLTAVARRTDARTARYSRRLSRELKKKLVLLQKRLTGVTN